MSAGCVNKQLFATLKGDYTLFQRCVYSSMCCPQVAKNKLINAGLNLNNGDQITFSV